MRSRSRTVLTLAWLYGNEVTGSRMLWSRQQLLHWLESTARTRRLSKLSAGLGPYTIETEAGVQTTCATASCSSGSGASGMKSVFVRFRQGTCSSRPC
ncbi:hypothetical protein PF008_g30208 [Phytophthora fragariae]|uniref:Uncharacterized protein n=1 Tax=Phytophthora fragariae TaxID=53985 RepID=A0A6G0Q687_9STRA|nr:hypothetical protein PF008_g30208 [Phytophthora fragariae]